MFKKEDISLEELQAKINEINKTYEQVYKLNEQFNEKTKEYNDAKLSFYKKAGLNIEQAEKNNS